MSSMFDQNNDASGQVDPSTNKTADELFAEMVGEGKKYGTPQELAKAYLHADSHISRLEKENEEYRIKVEAAKSVDDILAKLKPAESHPDTPAPKTPEQEAEKQPDIDSLVQKALESKMQEQTGSQNKAQVTEALRAKFGQSAGDTFDKKQQELGVDLEQLAAQSPQAVLALFGVTASSSHSSAPPVSGDLHQQGTKEPAYGTRAYAQFKFDKGEISRDQKFAMLHKFAADPELMNSQRSYK